MSKMKTGFQVVLFLSVVQVIYGQGCGERDTAAAGRQCQRPCQEDGLCRKQNRECVCDGLCGLSCLKKTCPYLDFGSEGSVTVIPSQRYIGSIATYSCNRGFTLVGNANRTCQSDKTWSDSEPVCRAVSNEATTATETHSCSFLPFPANGIVGYYQELRVEGAVATYRCDDGFTLTGAENRTCQRDGRWSDAEPVCIEDSCPDISIENGIVRHGHEDINRLSHEGDGITFSCNVGYQLISQDRLTCTNGQWTQRLPICQDAPCPLEAPQHGRITYWNGTEVTTTLFHGDVVTILCDDGYRLSDKSFEAVRCENAIFSQDLPSCEEASCPYEAPQHGRITYWNGTEVTTTLFHGDVVTILCEDGYRLSDKSFEAARCENGIFNQDLPACEEEYCPALPDEDYSLIIYNGTTSAETEFSPWTKVEVECPPGMYLERDGLATCRLGQWMPGIPTCSDPPPCPRPPISDSNIAIIELSGSRVTADRQSFNEGDALTFVCENDRVHQRLDGPQQIQCRNGEWIVVGRNEGMENAPTCATTGCRRPHINPNVVVHVGADDIPIGSRQFFTEGEIITSRCDDPRSKLLIGPVRRRCTGEGWTETAPRCDDSQLRIGVDNTRMFDFLPDGTFVVFPISGHVWINCRKLSGSPFASSATISTNSSARGRLVQRTSRLRRLVIYDPTPASSGTYICRDTNSLSRSINIRFQDIRCTEPNHISNGQREHIKATANTFPSTSYIFKETVRLYCNDGYRVNGTRDSECNYQGRWSPPLASCVAN